MIRKCFCTLGYLLCAMALWAQQTETTAQAMARQGFVNVRSLDSTIQVSLMYARADNFTGKILYTDLHEAYLHPKAARALVRAQQILKEKHPELSLKVYDAARPMHIQQKMWNAVAGTPKNIYVSNPKNGGGLHNYGMAVDLTLCDEKRATRFPWERISITWDGWHIPTSRLTWRKKDVSLRRHGKTANSCAT